MVVSGFVFWYAYPAFVSLFSIQHALGSGFPFMVEPVLILEAVHHVSTFLFSMIVASTIFASQTDNANDTRQLPRGDYTIVGLAFLGCILGLVPYVLLGNGISEVFRGILQARSAEKTWLPTAILGNSTSALSYLTSSAMIGGSCLLWVATVDRRLPVLFRCMMALAAAFFTAIIYFDQGTRSIFGLIIVPPLLIVVMTSLRRFRLRTYLVGVLAVTALVLLLQFQVTYRSTITRTNLRESIFENLLTLNDTIDFFKEMLFAAKLVPAYHGYFHESVLVQFLVSPIPRFIWASKPIPELVRVYTLYRWGIDILLTGGNMLPGVVGQYYMSWGWAGPIMVGTAIGWLAAKIDGKLGRLKLPSDLYAVTAYVMLIVWIFVSYRQISPGFSYSVFFVFLIVHLGRRRGTHKSISKVPPARKLNA
ncbi:MAG: hypothetical protein NVS2B7_10050 [Herpetosiphon sp.]